MLGNLYSGTFKVLLLSSKGIPDVTSGDLCVPKKHFQDRLVEVVKHTQLPFQCNVKVNR